jgi:hypothetical protein
MRALSFDSDRLSDLSHDARNHWISPSLGRSNRETVFASSIKGQPERISADNFASSR